VFYCAGCVKETQAAVPSLKAVWCVWLRVLQEELGLPLVSMSPRFCDSDASRLLELNSETSECIVKAYDASQLVLQAAA
jgi:hypothetical protein